MDLISCTALLLPALLLGGLGVAGGSVWAFARYGFRTVSGSVVTGLSRFGGFLLVAFRQKVTIALAFLTAFRQTGSTILSTLQGTSTPSQVVNVLLSELYRQTLLAPKLIAQGLGDFITLFSINGACQKIISINLLGSGILNIWTGISSAIIIAFGYRLFKGYVQKQEVDREMTFLFVTWIFLASALIQIGIEQTQIYEVIQKSLTLADVVSGPLNETVNQSVNSTK